MLWRMVSARDSPVAFAVSRISLSRSDGRASGYVSLFMEEFLHQLQMISTLLNSLADKSVFLTEKLQKREVPPGAETAEVRDGRRLRGNTMR